MANMLANTKAMISPSADYTPLMLPLASAAKKDGRNGKTTV